MEYVIIAGGINNGNNRRLMSDAFIVFDAVTDFNVTLSQAPSSYPIEGGSNISDNIATRNDVFELTGHVSNAFTVEHSGNAVSYDVKRTEQAVKLLRSIKESRTVMKVANEFEVFDNCILKEVSYRLTAQTMESIPFVLQFEVLRFAETKSVYLNIRDSGTTATGTPAGASAGKDAAQNQHNGTGGKSRVENVLTAKFGDKVPAALKKADVFKDKVTSQL